MILSVGDRLGPYLISARIGAGGMGEVYTARDTRLNRTVALKVLSPDLAGDAQFRERFNRETQAVGALNHPHICTVYDAGEATVNGGSSGPIQYLAMEYLEGETLASRLTRGPLAPAEALPVAVQLARALDKAHRADITHRDVKPANVMLTKGSAKLLDFGLAKFSPDGRWIAYTSDESGRQEVMIAAFPGPGPRRPVSTGGGESAAFAADGKTLFYRSDNHVWAAALTTDPALSVGRPYPCVSAPHVSGKHRAAELVDRFQG